MCPSLTPKSKKERPQESFQLINTSNSSNIYSRSFRIVVYDVSSVVSKDRNFSDGKLLPKYDRDGNGCDDNVILQCLTNALLIFNDAMFEQFKTLCKITLFNVRCSTLSLSHIY